MVSPAEINLRRVLVGHRAAVNVVDFDEKYIVSASGDRTIKVGLIFLFYLPSKQYDHTLVSGGVHLLYFSLFIPPITFELGYHPCPC